MKLAMNIPDYVKELADAGKGQEIGIPPWLAYEIANGTPLIEECQTESLISQYQRNNITREEQTWQI